MPIFPAYAATFNREEKKRSRAREEGRSETRYREGLDGDLTRGGGEAKQQVARGFLDRIQARVACLCLGCMVAHFWWKLKDFSWRVGVSGDLLLLFF